MSEDRPALSVGAGAGRFRARPLLIVPYLGYGSAHLLRLSGRVIKDEGFAPPRAEDSSRRNLMQSYKLFETDEVPGVRVRARFQSIEQDAVTDDEGYFHFELRLAQPLATSGWHTVDLAVVSAKEPIGATAQVLVPPPGARFGIISDIDDTVLWANVSRRLNMVWSVLRSNAHTRKPFRGVGALYRALQKGAGGSDDNPIFYVSSSPWNLYTPLVDFLRLQGIPLGPLALKDFGAHTIFSGHDHQSHKLARIEEIFGAYPHLQFILIGDSGEQDPEIYSKVVRTHPKRVRVIYIRSVDPDPSRIEAIDRLIEEVGKTQTQLVLVPDSEFAAVHAAAEGLIAADEVPNVRADKKLDGQPPPAKNV